MAKQQNNPDPGEVVIFFARARGGGAVVAESVRALADAVERAAQPRQTRFVKAIPGDAPREEKTLFDPVEEPAPLNVDDIVADNPDQPSATTARQKRGAGPKKDRNAG